ncbi:glycosyltransferase family 2 protein [Leeuwenhoekiella sp. LLG6367-2.1]|uniref:glycosyltransferase family 2 protein n=1 Tax=Leeuwenhoekiella sp. LLG6367-2.1 TaxID=3160833 RepID=UPI0038643FC0
MNTRNKNSIIIPYFNTPEYIERCLISAKQQFGGVNEIIVIDDGSNALAKKRIQDLSALYDTIIYQENSGQAKARNVGISKASGRYILVLDSDDYFTGDFGSSAIKFIEEQDCKLVCCNANRIVRGKIVDQYSPRGGSLKDFLFYNSAMGTAIFKKEDWSIIGGYDEQMRQGWEDWEFYIRLLKSGGKCKVVKDVYFNYTLRGNSTTSIANSCRPTLLNYIFKKHKDCYIQNFENFVDFIAELYEQENNKYLKSIKSKEFLLGNALLKIPRLIKQGLK